MQKILLSWTKVFEKAKWAFSNTQTLLFGLIILFCSFGAEAQSNFFSEVENRSTLQPSKVTETIKKYNVLRLDETALRNYLSKAPMEFQDNSTPLALEIPLPNGRVETFGLMESPILTPEIAAKHPEIRTYTGKGAINHSAIIRFSLTSNGFSAIILNEEEGTIYYEPYAKDSPDTYLTYFAKDAAIPEEYSIRGCGVSDSDTGHKHSSSENRNMTGGTLSTYRLAIAGNGEFTGQNGGTAASGFAAIVGYVNRMNAVYRNELSVQFILVSGMNLVYTDPMTDPYDNSDQGVMLGQNQTNLDAVIGSANYDVGHVMGFVGPGFTPAGLAFLDALCNDNIKAGGSSQIADSGVGQIFNDKVLFHEVGHMFGMNHSYNSVQNVCTTRNPATSVEPGGGTTIMSYASICGSDDYIQSYQTGTILNFHTISYEQAVAYLSTIGGCATTASTGNTAPVVTMPSAHTIPKSTPFALTGSADAPGAGDSYTYSWEGTDIGEVVPDATTLDDPSKSPFFRTYAPSSSPTRTFPILSAILNGTNQAKGDKLPSVGRTTTHRMTVRDNNADGGGVTYGDVTITIDGSIGPFLETTNLAATYMGNSTQTITWSVNGTDVATPNINILLSVDGGQTFPFTLAANTANDGAQNVTFPNVQTSMARIKVEAVGNIFFDISNSDFSISISGCSAASSNICPTTAMAFDQGDSGLNLSLNGYYGTTLTSHVFDLDAGDPTGQLANATVQNGTTCQTDWGIENYEVLDFAVSATGDYTFNDATNSIVYSVFTAAGYNPAMPCAGTFVGSNAWGGISWNQARTLSLAECTTYKLVVWTVNSNYGMKTINMSGAGSILSAGSVPANTGYTYVAVNTVNNQIAAQSSTADFTSLAGGTYYVYGASYKNGGATPPANANPAGWVGQTLATVQSTECVVFSSNFKPLTVIGSSTCSITSSLSKTDETVSGANDGTITVTATCSGTCGTLQYSLNGGAPQASNTFTGLAPGTYTVTTTNVGAATCSDTKSITVNAGSPSCVPPTVNVPTVTQPTCSVPTGTIEVSAFGANTLEYSVNGVTYQTSNVFSGLAPGNYNINVREIDTPSCMSSYANNPVSLNNAICISITAANGIQNEGNVGTTPFTFNVTRTGTTGSTGTTVDYAVSGSGTNQANAADFGGTFPGGQINFAAGETMKVLTINVSGDTDFEPDEGFSVTLSNASGGATISSSVSVGTILNDDCQPLTWYQDSDGDGYGNVAVTLMDCTQPAGYVSNSSDCDDNDGNVNPGATEVCNGIDDNCNGMIDEGVLTTFYQDSDGDGFGNPEMSQQACSAPAGYVANNQDCDDGDGAINPNGVEMCNGVDDNCNGMADEPLITGISVSNMTACNDNGTSDPSDDTFMGDVTLTFTMVPNSGLLRVSGDGTAETAVANVSGTSHTFSGVTMSADGGAISLVGQFTASNCLFTESNAGTAPASCSTCDILSISVSNLGNCDNQNNTNPSDDTFTADVTVTFVTPPSSGTLDLSGDGTASISVGGLGMGTHTFTGVTMSADGGAISLTAAFSADPNCTLTNSNAGTALPPCCLVDINSIAPTAETCAGYGDGTITVNATGTGQLEYSIDGGQSYQLTSFFEFLSPGTYNIVVRILGSPTCMDSGTATVAHGGQGQTWYQDWDNDGYSNGLTIVSCTQPNGHKLASQLIATSGDCNDYDPTQFPGQVFFLDADGDGYSDGTSTTACAQPANYYPAGELTATNGDCDDNDAAVNPGAVEICNGIDDNCNGQVDEGTPAGLTYVGNVYFPNQAAVDAFSQCYSIIDGNLTIQNSGVNDLSNLINLVEVTGYVRIKSTSLASMTGLDNLTTIGGYLRIEFNHSLLTLDGLDAVTSVGSYLRVYRNVNLVDCCAIHDLINNGGVSGSITIVLNDTGCDSVAEINTDCAGGNSLVVNPNQVSTAVAIDEPLSMALYPNPAKEEVNVQVFGQFNNGTLRVYNQLGEVIHIEKLSENLTVQQLSIEKWNAGIYFVQLSLDGNVLTQKLIVR